ncbi:hypothetical protein PRIPAC_95803 [Pristionchus pacificus]|uniref:Uncharacterized protein n=1 Tax=Pristionchus pacificus TaxID=54126 RepID=A0A2A6CUR8_PRIPA|nr:hypothetical protein PRIPAC_95803 [Pristionchus pacificus]|eukprot:PDM81925.1 hypothetical protein PRIPAC_34079 [Pristionchus pacificus]
MTNSSESNDGYQQTELLYRLDQANTAIMIAAGVITFPPALFTYFRVLTVPDFKNEFLLKLFVLNGIANFLIYIINVIEMQFINWPSTYYIYKWLRDTPIPLFFRFMQDFSYSLMWQTTFFISLNRYLCIQYVRVMKRNALKYFTFSCSVSFVIATVVAFPLFFCGFTYKEIELEDGQLAHYPTYKSKQYLEIPATYHQNFTSFVTLIVNILIVIKFNELRQDIGENSKMKGKPEHGLLISSILMFLIHLLQTILLIIHPFAPHFLLTLCIPLLITLATTVPFWTLIGFAHSLRRTILNGTPLHNRREMTVTFSANVTNVSTF